MTELSSIYIKHSLLLPLLKLNNPEIQWILAGNTPLTPLFFEIVEEYKCVNEKGEYRYVENAIKVLELMNRRYRRVPLEGFPNMGESLDVKTLLSHKTLAVRRSTVSYLISAMQIIYMEPRLPTHKVLWDEKRRIEELMDPKLLKQALEGIDSLWSHPYLASPRWPRISNVFNPTYPLEYDQLMNVLRFFWPSLVITVPQPSS